MIVDLFAGPGGWDQGLRAVAPDAHARTVGIELDRDACRTANAAGHHRIRANVEDFPIRGDVEGVIASPPCTAFSVAGKGHGTRALADLGRALAAVADGADPADFRLASDPTAHLVLYPLALIRDTRPAWVAMEQVPPVLPLWRQLLRLIRWWGYRGWAAVLNAADFGVAQTRRRAFLVARLDSEPVVPFPTHSRGGGGLFGLERWVPMAAVLTEDTLRQLASHEDWECNGPRRSRAVTSPSLTVTGRRVMGQWHLNRRSAVGRGVWIWERPATTVVGNYRPDIIAAPGHHDGSRQNAEGSVLVTFNDVAAIQDFPADYPWQGSPTSRFRQVGNAVPPGLARVVLASALDARIEVAA